MIDRMNFGLCCDDGAGNTYRVCGFFARPYSNPAMGADKSVSGPVLLNDVVHRQTGASDEGLHAVIQAGAMHGTYRSTAVR